MSSPQNTNTMVNISDEIQANAGDIHGFSIDWVRFNLDIDLAPSNLANEIRRITNVPAECSAGHLINFYLAQSIAAQEVWQKHLLKVCACMWIRQAAKQWPHGDIQEQMKTQIIEAWNKFCEAVENMPDDDTLAGC